MSSTGVFNPRVRFAVITDIHFGTLGYSKEGILAKLGTRAPRLLRAFVRRMNKEVKPAFVVQMGDIIEDKTPNADRVHIREAIQILKGLRCPLYHTIGNHDLRNITLKTFKDLTGIKNSYYSFDAGGIRGIVLFSDDRNKKKPVISPAQCRWLARNLKGCALPTIIFLHHSLGEEVAGNVWFAHLPHRALVQERKRVRKMLAMSGDVRTVVSRHLHWNKKETFTDIPYFTIQSLVENFRGNRTPSASYAIVEIAAHSIKIRVEGNDSCVLKHSFKG